MAKVKRLFLVTDVEKLASTLETSATSADFYSYKKKDSHLYVIDDVSYVLEIYKKALQGLAILVVIADNQFSIFQEIDELQEITKNEKYSKEYLEVFGNPAKYDFSLHDVFKKCDSIGLNRMDLHFRKGMSSVKVFQVLLYRLNQIFILHFQGYNKAQIDFDTLESSLESLRRVFNLSKGIFHKKIYKKIVSYLDSLYLLLNEQDRMDHYKVNFESFIYDEANFYAAKKADTYIYLFVIDKVHKSIQEAFEISRRLDTKSSINKQYQNLLGDITATLDFFSSILSKEEIDEIKQELQILKTR